MVDLVHMVLVDGDGPLTDDEAATAIDTTYSEANDDNINFMQHVMHQRFGVRGYTARHVGVAMLGCST